MNLRDEVEKIKSDGYSEANAEAKLCQDILIKAISQSSLSRNITIKGGVVMRSISGNVRRATQDLDLDFIKYSISESSIKLFIEKLNNLDGICLNMISPIEDLKHQDYKGKRIFVEVKDVFNHILDLKIDVGVHKDLDIEQEEYCFDLCFQEDAASILINSSEQMIVEKLKAILRFGTRSTRYKDVFDICYLLDKANIDTLRGYIQKYIFDDTTLDIYDMEEIRNRITRVFNSSTYTRQLERSKKNWLDMSVKDVLRKNLEFVNKL